MIKTNKLTRSYGDFIAVDDVSFNIKQGEIVGLLGHNGAGKTTIMKMLTGYLEPGSGTIEIDGLDISQQQRAVQKKIGYLPENCPVYPEMTIIDYLNYAAGLHGIPEALRSQSVFKAISRTELNEKATQPIATLSRGYRQRVGVAQAILHEPQILILDEPTNGLDPSQIQHMRALIKELAENSTVILSTHILHEVQAICDRVIIIRNGKKALDARLDELQTISHRLLIAVNSDRDKTNELFDSIDVVTSVEYLSSESGQYRYALGINDTEQSLGAASLVAKTIIEQGVELYTLKPERYDLETVFQDINRAEESEEGHA